MTTARRAKDRKRKRKPGLVERVTRLEALLTPSSHVPPTRRAGTTDSLGAALAILRDEYQTKVPQDTRREAALRCAAERIERELGFTGERTEVTESHRLRARIGVN